jgi:hypothetical protein
LLVMVTGFVTAFITAAVCYHLSAPSAAGMLAACCEHTCAARNNPRHLPKPITQLRRPVAWSQPKPKVLAQSPSNSCTEVNAQLSTSPHGMYMTCSSGASPALMTARAAANSLRSSTSRGLGGTAQHSTAQHSTAQHSTAQHSTQHGTAQHEHKHGATERRQQNGAKHSTAHARAGEHMSGTVIHASTRCAVPTEPVVGPPQRAVAVY